MRNRLLAFFFLLFLCSNLRIAAQENTPISLSLILTELQQRFDVQFNYASDLIEQTSIHTPIDTSWKLKETLRHLAEESNLDFVFISKKIISIKRKPPSICGYLKDKDSGMPLPYVTVQYGTKGTITDEEGFFKLELKEPNTIIQIRHIGHKPIRREAKFFTTKECGIVYLIPNQVALSEVTLYDYLIRGIDKLDNGAFQIDFHTFSILPGLIDKDVLQSVQALPGIQSVDETVSNINIRGGSNDQNLITWDGIKMYQTGHFFGLISMYNPNITQKVILRKNGSSAAETDGVSGTIAMQTEAYLNPSVKGNIGVNLIDANGFADVPLSQNISLQVAARKSISDLVETPTYSEYFNRIIQGTELENNASTIANSNVAFDFYDTSFRLLYHSTDKDHFRLNFINTTNSLTFNENAAIDGVAEIRESRLSQNSIAAGLQYQKEWTQNFRTELGLYETDYTLRALNANILENQRFSQKNSVSETGIKLKAKNTLSSQIQWTNGYNFTETKVTNLDDVDDPRFIRLEGEVLRTHALFTEIGFASKNTKTGLNLGLRYNYLAKFKKQLWEPRLSFNHTLGTAFNIEVLGEFKHQSTSQIINFQNDFLGIEKRRWQLSNDASIPIIRSKQVSLGFSYTKQGWLFNIIPFYKKVDGITTQSQGFQDQFEFLRSSGSYESKGLDILLRKQIRKSHLWLSYSYLKSDYFFDQLAEASFPSNFDITHALSLGANYTWKQLILAAGLNWRTGRPLTIPQPNNEVLDGAINFDRTNDSRQADYLRADISARYGFKWSAKTKAEIGVSVWNFLDQDNSINVFYRLNALENAQRIEQNSLGITPNASFKLIFL